MIRKSFVIFIILISFTLINIACQNASQTSYDTSHIKGFVLDTVVLHSGLDSVNISIKNMPLSTVSDVNGYFQFLNINMPRSEMAFYIVATRNNYQTDSQYVYVHSDDTTKINLYLMHN